MSGVGAHPRQALGALRPPSANRLCPDDRACGSRAPRPRPPTCLSTFFDTVLGPGAAQTLLEKGVNGGVAGVLTAG